MNVIISPNVKKTSVRINPSGDIIDARTKQVIERNQPDFLPSIEEIKAIQNKPAESVTIQEEHSLQTEAKPPTKIEDMINSLVAKKVEEMVAKKVEEALSKL